jgi:ribosomal protein L24E
VCGRHITEAQALPSAEHEGTTYLFCSERCRMLCALRRDSFAVGEAQLAAKEAHGR